MKTLNVSLIYSSIEPGFKICMPPCTNACLICVSGRKDNSFIFLFFILSGTHFINPLGIFLPWHVIVIITHASIIRAKAFSKHKINHSTGEQSLNSKTVNSFISANTFVTVSCKR